MLLDTRHDIYNKITAEHLSANFEISKEPIVQKHPVKYLGVDSDNNLRPRLHGNGSMWNRTRTVRIGLAFTRELMEPFHTELLAVPELVHLESRSRKEPNQKVLV